MQKTLKIELQELREQIANDLITWAELHHGGAIDPAAINIVKGKGVTGNGIQN